MGITCYERDEVECSVPACVHHGCVLKDPLSRLRHALRILDEAGDGYQDIAQQLAERIREKRG